MKHLPLIYPIAFAALITLLTFAGVWSIAESAVNGQPGVAGQTLVGSSEPTRSTADVRSDDFEWYQQAAIFVCPLH